MLLAVYEDRLTLVPRGSDAAVSAGAAQLPAADFQAAGGTSTTMPLAQCVVWRLNVSDQRFLVMHSPDPAHRRHVRPTLPVLAHAWQGV